MTIAIAILNYNGAELLQEFLPSILAHSTNAKVYVIDNKSTDNSLAVIGAIFPMVTTIALDDNSGYAGGYNKGLQQIDAEVVCLLNSDIEVTPNWLLPINDFLKAHPEVAVVQPKIKDLARPDHFEYAGAAGGYLDIMGLPYCRGRVGSKCEKDNGQYDNNMQVTWASGACLVVRKSVFDALNGFDASFFMHFEEIDLCLRAQAKGHQVWAVGKSEVFHKGAASLSKENSRKLYYNIRNSLLTYTKTLPLMPLLWVYLARGAFDTTLVLFFMIKLKFDHVYAIIRAYDAFFNRFSTSFSQRKYKLNPIKRFSVLLSFKKNKV
ncbi:MAG: dTDP-Rha--alpha-D-GlcNAc-pyrophosphate polyprenol alpha-3-L-rhamnosyltransferase [Flavobacteriaceae bacterium]|jgi:GT2 family glycosyltransferase|nr:dTDP-Rha--alpha-D-GlcNAc-pyrophosphate polyprenol alpha-3-L-rhamnosyltransferase [Flavobacteriaceae bacterium]|tara:strand:+ start:21763 stop:22728 length:966 start_codon:yes stop_codon:yes gene_type:complete